MSMLVGTHEPVTSSEYNVMLFLAKTRHLGRWHTPFASDLKIVLKMWLILDGPKTGSMCVTIEMWYFDSLTVVMYNT